MHGIGDLQQCADDQEIHRQPGPRGIGFRIGLHYRDRDAYVAYDA